jgi:hypothetical protein
MSCMAEDLFLAPCARPVVREIRRSPESFPFSSMEGGSQPRYAKAPSSIATGLRRPHLAPKIPPQKKHLWATKLPQQKAKHQTFLSLFSPGTILSVSKSIRISISLYQNIYYNTVSFFSCLRPCSKIGAASFSKWHLDSSSG